MNPISFPPSDLVDLLNLERIEANHYQATNGPGNHVFGGQVMAQALIAASRTVDAKPVHSLHAYFLRPGNAAKPILFEVDRIRDGRSFATRRVVGIQTGRAILSLSASFQTDESGLEHQISMPRVARPETLDEDLLYYEELAKAQPEFHRFLFRFEAIDSRQVEGIQMFPREGRTPLAPRKHTWIKLKSRLEADAVAEVSSSQMHSALLGYLSDLDFLSTSLLPHGRALEGRTLQATSLDHAIWFQRQPRVDEWLLFAKESTWAGSGRGKVQGQIFDQTGQLVAVVMQECLIRLRPKD